MRALFLALAVTAGCGSNAQDAPPGVEPLGRTEFTSRIENFFEYEPLRAGRASQFRIHLTDLADGTPVAGAEISLKLIAGAAAVAETQARPGSVAGIYLAELTPPGPGGFELEFHVRAPSLDDTMRLSGFSVSE